MALVKVYIAPDAPQAHIVRMLLQREGIRATVLGDQLALATGALPLTRGMLPAVWVNDEDLATAKALIDRFESAGCKIPTPGTPWRCPRCGEELEPQFTDCWNCGEPRPDANATPTSQDPPHGSPEIELDVPCQQCGYNLRGLDPKARCPECGDAILPSLLQFRLSLSPEELTDAHVSLWWAIDDALRDLGCHPEGAVFLLSALPRALDALTRLEEADSSAAAAQLCRSLAAHAVREFADEKLAASMLLQWKLNDGRAVGDALMKLIEHGLIRSPLPFVPADFREGPLIAPR